MPRKKNIPTGFGKRLAALRQARGLSQRAFATALGVSQRTVSYYESTTGHPQTPMLTEIANVLETTVDALLGREKIPRSASPAPNHSAPDQRRLWRRFQILAALPDKDQRAILRMLDTMAVARLPAAKEDSQ